MTKEKQIEEMAKILCGMKNSCDGCMWNKTHCNERNYAEEIYNAGYQKQSEWISVEERLPECRKFVIVCDEYDIVGEAYYLGEGRFEWADDEECAFATHWMPFPEAPKMKGGGEG